MVLALWESTLDNQMLILPGKQTVPFSLSVTWLFCAITPLLSEMMW